MVKDEVMHSDTALVATKEHQVSMFAGLRARLASRRARNQRGAILIEALIMAVVGAGSMAGYLAITTSSQDVVRHHSSVDVVDQYVTGLSEEMRVLPWASVANCSADPTRSGDPSNTDTSDDWTAPAGTAYYNTCPSRYLTYYQEDTIANIKIRVRTSVRWSLGGWHDTGLANPAAEGWKQVTYVVTWKPIGSATSRTRTLSVYRNSSPGEALVTSLPVDGAPL